MPENRIEELVKKIALQQMTSASKPGVSTPVERSGKLSKTDYPIARKRPELVKSATGKGIQDITLQKVNQGEVKPEDIRISAQVLEYQAQVAEANEKKQFALNLRRGAEMTRIPDEKVLEIYELLRPRRASKQQLLEVAEELEGKYQAPLTARLVREAAEVYADRNILGSAQK